MNCDENTQTRFEYPQIIIIKGGLELINYNVIEKKYIYAKLPTSISVIKKDEKDSCNFKTLMDLGKHFMMAEINFDFYSVDRINSTYLQFAVNLNYIPKRHLPKDKLINLISYTTMRYK